MLDLREDWAAIEGQALERAGTSVRDWVDAPAIAFPLSARMLAIVLPVCLIVLSLLGGEGAFGHNWPWVVTVPLALEALLATCLLKKTRLTAANLVLPSFELELLAPVRAARLQISPLQIGCSLSVHDSLLQAKSRFQAEVERLTWLLCLARTTNVMFLLDEMLGGTNSADRLIGAKAVIEQLAASGAVGLITTHDLALTEIGHSLDGWSINVHFEECYRDGEMRFDYQMRPGALTRTNGVNVMSALGLLPPRGGGGPCAEPTGLRPEPLGCAGFRLCGFLFAISRRSIGLERAEKMDRDSGNVIDGSQEQGFVRLRRLVEPGDLAHVLQRRGPRLLLGHRRIEVEQGLDVPAHSVLPR
jgi:MutS-like protein